MPKKGQKKKDFTPAQEKQREGMRRDLTKAQIKKVRDLANEGWTQEEIGAELGMSGRTLRRRMEEVPEVREAYDLGRAKWHGVVMGKFHLVINRIGTDKELNNDKSLLMFYLKAQRGWVETQGVRLGGSLEEALDELEELDEDDDEDAEEAA